MYFKRKIDEQLAAWTKADSRKPLVLRGARQTGKTSAVRELGRGFEHFIELNLERFADARFVTGCKSATEFLLALRTRHDVSDLGAKKTLLFFDEIQESPQVVKWLRFLYEDNPELHVVAAGSLLETRLEQRGLSFPVGRVTFLTLRPMSFLEFAQARGKGVMVQVLEQAAMQMSPLPGAVHDQAMDLLREYVIVGGMPEAVARWVETGHVGDVGRVHEDLVQALAEDIQKYRGSTDIDDLEAAFAALKLHYGRRFKYESFAPGYPSRRMKSALRKLKDALLVEIVQGTSSLQAPLWPRTRAAPKLIPLDVGLALHMLGASSVDLGSHPLDRLLDGRVAEMLVGQALVSSRHLGDDLFFWVGQSSIAEVDFIEPGPHGLVPVEVKSGKAGSLRSLHQFLHRSGQRVGLRLHAAPLGRESHTVQLSGDTLRYDLLNVPLYLAELVPAILAGHG